MEQYRNNKDYRGTEGTSQLRYNGTFTHSAEATLTGVGSLTAEGHRDVPGLATLFGEGSITADGSLIKYGAATLEGAGSVEATGSNTLAGAATLSGAGSVTAVGSVNRNAVATLTGVGSIIASGENEIAGVATLTGVGSLTAVGVLVLPATATLTGVGSVTAVGVRLVAGVVTLTGVGTVIAVGTVPVQVGGLARTALQYIVVIADLDGTPIDEVPAKNLQMSYTHNAPGGITFHVPLKHEKSTAALIAPGKREIVVWRNGIKVWGGYLWFVTATSGDANMTVQGEGYFSRFRKRYVDDDLVYTNEDQLDIAWSLIDFTQGQTNGDLGITRDPGEVPSGVMRDRRYPKEERQFIGEILEGFSELHNGFDFNITPDKVWQAFYPKRGGPTDHVFELGKNLGNIAVQHDAFGVATEITGLGEGEGNRKCIAVRFDATAQTEYGLLEDILSLPEVKHFANLDSRVREELRLRNHMRDHPQFSIIVHDAPEIFSYNIGDEVRVRADDGYIQIDEDYRIVSIVVQVGDSGKEIGTLVCDNLVEAA